VQILSLFWRFLNILSLAAVLAVNFLATALPINNVTTAEISNRFPVLFTPAGYVFSIWGLIYLLLTGFVIYQAMPGQAGNPLLKRIGALFFFSSLFNSLWIFAWHYERTVLSLLIMLALLATLILIYSSIYSVKAAGPADRWLVKVPFSVYLGWISVATIANVSVTLYSLGWNGWGLGGPAWTVVMISAAVILGLLAARLRRDTAFVLVLIWALIGIGVKQSAIAALQGAAWGGAAVLVLGLVVFTVAKKDLAGA
jgi:translocator protein